MGCDVGARVLPRYFRATEGFSFPVEPGKKRKGLKEGGGEVFVRGNGKLERG